MEVTINYNGQAVAVEVTLEVYEFLDRADHKTENLFHEQRRHWDGREFDEYIITTEGVGVYGETPEEYLCRMETLHELKGVADQIIKEQQRVSKIKNNPEEFHWHDEYATLNFFRFICKNIGNLRNGEIEKMVTRLNNIDQKAVENHVNGAVWAFDYDKMFCVLMENEICRKVCEKNKYNSWMNLIGQYCVSRN